ncbi:hypothetical protein [Yoonia sp. SS1-5]|uniref:Uncharacterized protein n=1 Tax=Yoonia rhodophyticola TaxID=3137370 RepID=A0AAN0NLF1_9RHOB
MDFLQKWVPGVTGAPLSTDRGKTIWDKHLPYVRTTDSFDLISDPVVQSIADFVLCQHSRNTFAPSKMGNLRDQFDAELVALLRPHADSAGNLTFRSSTRLTLVQIL